MELRIFVGISHGGSFVHLKKAFTNDPMSLFLCEFFSGILDQRKDYVVTDPLFGEGLTEAEAYGI